MPRPADSDDEEAAEITEQKRKTREREREQMFRERERRFEGLEGGRIRRVLNEERIEKEGGGSLEEKVGLLVYW